MTPETALFWWWLGILTRRRYDALISAYGDLDSALVEMSPNMLMSLGLKGSAVAEIFKRIEKFNPEKVQKTMRGRNVGLLTLEDPGYPQNLLQAPDAPTFLSYRGNIDLLQSPLIALVGTRGMTPYGKRVVERFVPPLVRAGCVTVSGLALGVDAEIAKETIAHGGKTIAVLGHGLSSIYPRSNERLADEILENGGLLVSEFPLDLPPSKYTFPARNRIIAGLSLATIVCEAPEGSGSVITAELALEYNRDVYAVPGPIFETQCAGCHRLIVQGHAKLACDATDVLRDLGMVASSDTPIRYDAMNPEEEQVLALLTGMPQTMDTLSERTGLPAPVLGSTLTVMELAGAVRNIGGGQWVRL